MKKTIALIFVLLLLGAGLLNKKAKPIILNSNKVKVQLIIEPIQNCTEKNCLVEFFDKEGHHYKIYFPSNGLFLEKIDKDPNMNVYLTYYQIKLSNKNRKCITIIENDSYSFFYSSQIYNKGYELVSCLDI